MYPLYILDVENVTTLCKIIVIIYNSKYILRNLKP